MKYLIYLFLFLALPAFAHPGSDFDENNCHVCVADCEIWGLSAGQNHCHLPNGGYTNSAGHEFDSSGGFISASDKLGAVILLDEMSPEINNPAPASEAEPVLEQVVNEQNVNIKNNSVETSTPEIIGKKISEWANIFSSSFESGASLNKEEKSPVNIIIYLAVGLLVLLGVVFLIKSFKNRK